MLIHRIWLGGEMPEKYQQYGQLWLDLNPGYELHDWTEEEIFDTEWINQEVLNQMYKDSKRPHADMIAYYTHVADVVDYELPYSYGGWYFNTDLKPIRPLSHLETDHLWAQAHFAMEDDIHAVNMAMYCKKDNQLFAEIIDNLPKRYFGMPGAFMNATTGVQLIMQTLATTQSPYVLYPRAVFNPIHWSDFGYGKEPDIDRNYPEETVAVHEWLHRTNQRGQRVLETNLGN